MDKIFSAIEAETEAQTELWKLEEWEPMMRHLAIIVHYAEYASSVASNPRAAIPLADVLAIAAWAILCLKKYEEPLLKMIAERDCKGETISADCARHD